MTEHDYELAVVQFGPYLVGRANNLLGNFADAEETVQQTFTELCKTYAAFDLAGPASVKTWLTARLNSRCIDRWRSRGRLRCRSLEEMTEREQAGIDRDQPASLVTMDEDRYQVRLDVRKALGALPDTQCRVVQACLIEGWTQVEASAAFGLSRPQVQRVLSRATASLRHHLAAYAHRDEVPVQSRSARLEPHNFPISNG